MEFNGRGFYNTLLFSSSEIKEKWQIEDYQKMSTDELFKRLQKENIHVTEASLKEYMHSAESPEDLTDILCPEEEGSASFEKSYLVIFELWKRLLPKKETLSIFCDRLDHLIHAYDEGAAVADELVKALNDLMKIFEDMGSSGLSQKETYEIFSSYLAQDLETFIYDFLCDLIEAGEKTLAFDFIFGFYDFLHDKPALDLLKTTINLIENPDDSESVFLNTIDKIFEKKRHNLILDAIYFTHDNGFIGLSKKIAQELLSKVKGDEKMEALALLEPLIKPLGLKS
jgi:hypothetical protein